MSYVIIPNSERPFDLPLQQWSKEENAAMKLAPYRMVREKEGTLTNYPEFLSYSGNLWPKFTLLLERSFLDVVAQMEERDISDPRECLHFLVFGQYFQQAE